MRWSLLVFLLVGCTKHYPPGSVAQGSTCEYSIDCAPVAGATAICACPSSTVDDPVCSVEIVSQFSCNGVVCTADQYCSSSGCNPRAAEGQSCASAVCLSSLFCNPSMVCEAARAVGQSCTSFDSCAAPAFCDTSTNTCSAAHGAGGYCDPADLQRVECAAGLNCASLGKKCVQPQPNGSACGEDSECLSSYCSSGTCTGLSCRPYCDTHPCGPPP